MRPFLFVGALLSTAWVGQAHAANIAISVNFSIGGNDNNAVNAGETSIVGNSSTLSYDGSLWNNVLLRPTGTGSPTSFITNTTGGNFVQLTDSDGANNGRLTSTLASGGGNSAFGSVTTNPGLTGDSGLFQSYLSFGSTFAPTETLTVSNLSSVITSRGYYVVLFFDRSPAPLTYGHSITDGIVSATYWTNDTSTDGDANNDGVIEWTLATGATSGTATSNANYSVFPVMHGSSFTITGLSTGRVPLSGFQIVSIHHVPEPSGVVLTLLGLTTLGAVGIYRRRRRA